MSLTVESYPPRPVVMKYPAKAEMLGPPKQTGPPTLRPFQRDGVDFMRANGYRMMLADEAGAGKQQPIDSLVLTPSGWRPIGSMRVGDEVIGSDGRATVVTGVFPQGVKPSYRVVFSDDSHVEVGPEHLWTMRYRKGGRTWADLTLTTDQLRLRPVIEQHHDNGTKEMNLAGVALYLPMLSAPVEFAASDPLPIEPYLLGQLIANGSLTYGTPQITTGVKDWPHVAGQFETRGITTGNARTYGNAVHVTIPGIVSIVRDLGLDKLSALKRIPRAYLHAQVADRMSLFWGLMDGDGSCSATGNRLSYHTLSLGLADDVVELVECLGGIASVNTADRSHHGKPVEYHVRIRSPEWVAPFTLPRKLDRYQPGAWGAPCRTLVAVQYIRDVESVCIAVAAPDRLYATEHAILTHNTIQVLTAIAEDRAALTPCIVACPSSVAINWRRETRKWLPRSTTSLVNGQSWRCPRKVPDIIVVPWDLLAHHEEALMALRPKLVVLDEAHYARNPDTQRGEAAERICAAVPHKMLLTGTPLVNTVDELLILRRLLGSKHPPMLRRLLADVAPDVPPKTRVRVNVPISATARREYERIENEFKAYLEDYLRVQESNVDEMEARKNRAMKAASLVKVGYLRRLLGRAKAPAAAAFCAKLLQAGEPVVIFAEHMDVLDAVGEALDKVKVSHARVDGGVARKKRQKAIDDFQAGKVSVILCTQAAKEGITLTRARNVCFIERWWTPAAEEQGENRCARIGQRYPTKVWFLLVDNSFDVRSSEIIEAKRRLVMQHVGAQPVETVDGSELLRGWLKGQSLDDFTMPDFPALPTRYGTYEIRFAAKNWLPDDAIRWAGMNGYPIDAVRRSGHHVRLSVRSAAGFVPGTFKLVRLGPDIEAIVGQPKRMHTVINSRRRTRTVRLTDRARRTVTEWV